MPASDEEEKRDNGRKGGVADRKGSTNGTWEDRHM